MNFMIHTCNDREWYVRDFLVPSMVGQGIPFEEITVWHDYNHAGNLTNFMNSMRYIGETQDPGSGIWHLQDDVIISSKFSEETKKHNSGIVCGFCCEAWDNVHGLEHGKVTREGMWMSMQCMRIPNDLAAECGDWFFDYVVPRKRFKTFVMHNKFDDVLWRLFLEDRHISITGYNIAPNIVNHIDYLLGGSVINQERQFLPVSYYWDEPELVDELEKRLREREHEVHDTCMSAT